MIAGVMNRGEVRLGQLFAELLMVGFTAFGGFMALIAQVQKVVVGKRRWIDEAVFADDIAVAAMLPGPVAVNLVAATGYRIGGGLGALTAVVAVVLPGFFIICAFAAAFAQVAHLQGALQAVIAGMLPVVVVIILTAAQTQARKAVTCRAELVIASLAAVFLLLPLGHLAAPLVLLAAGAAGVLIFPAHKGATEVPLAGAPSGDLLKLILPLLLVVFYLVPYLVPDYLPVRLLLTFAGMSPTLFGGGLIMVPLLQGLVVDEMHWLSGAAFAAALSASQMTPGPIVSSVVFAGFIVAGWLGALMAAIGIFAPTAIMTIGAVHLADRIKRLAWLRCFMRGVRAAVVGLILAAALLLLQQVGLRPVVLAILPLAWLALTRHQVAPYWAIAAGGIAALLLHTLPGGDILLQPLALPR